MLGASALDPISPPPISPLDDPMSTEATTKADEAYERVEQMVVTLQLAPGTQISESELSRQLDIGRTPL